MNMYLLLGHHISRYKKAVRFGNIGLILFPGGGCVSFVVTAFHGLKLQASRHVTILTKGPIASYVEV